MIETADRGHCVDQGIRLQDQLVGINGKSLDEMGVYDIGKLERTHSMSFLKVDHTYVGAFMDILSSLPKCVFLISVFSTFLVSVLFITFQAICS